MSRYFLSRFLALSDINENEIINDEIFKDVSDDETSESDNETVKTLRDRRARVHRRVFRLFFCCRCLTQKLKTKL